MDNSVQINLEKTKTAMSEAEEFFGGDEVISDCIDSVVSKIDKKEPVFLEELFSIMELMRENHKKYLITAEPKENTGKARVIGKLTGIVGLDFLVGDRSDLKN